ncbi:MAG: FlgD immunoglobulin-like domain containing protein [Candidatus Eisenbacteria bacterium]
MRTLAVSLAVLLALSLTAALVFAGPREPKFPSVARAGDPAPLLRDFDYGTMVDANEIAMFLTNSGGFGRDLESPGGPAGTFFPRGTDKTCLYAAGLWIGGYVGGELRVTTAEYSLEYQPGRMLPGGGWTDPADPRYRVYKLEPGSGPGDADYDEWPVDDGAPVDRGGLPLHVADQTLWSVFHDANPAVHTNLPGGTAPLGIEVTHLTYAFDGPWPLGRVIVMEYRIWNRGAQTIENARIGLWMDPDVGDAGNDLAGCDSLLDLSFVVSTAWDDVYEDQPPAVGIALLRAPGDPDAGAYAAVDFVNGQDPSSAQASYNVFRGLTAQGEPVIDPTTGLPTRFWHAGRWDIDEGWRDDSPADKRCMLSAGPFTLEPGQTDSIRCALVIGQDDSDAASVACLKAQTRAIRSMNEKGLFPWFDRWAIVSVAPDPFDPGDPGAVVTASVIAPTDGFARILIRNEAGNIVRLLLEGQIASGYHQILWDGRDEQGLLVPAGNYRFELQGSPWPESAGTPHLDQQPFAVVYRGGSEEAAAGDPGSLASGGTTIVPCTGAWLARDVAARSGGNLILYDLQGRIVREIPFTAGARGVFWDGRSGSGGGDRLPSGLYFYRIDGASAPGTRKVLLLPGR